MINIGTTGHRNLNKSYINIYKRRLYKELLELKRCYSNITLYSAFAEGADRLILYEAMKLDIDFIAVLPMKKDLYLKDFDYNSIKEFESLLDKAVKIITVDQCNTHTKESCYEKAGHYISDNSHILFALWDGLYTNLQGGTSEIVKYHRSNNKKIHHIKVTRSIF